MSANEFIDLGVGAFEQQAAVYDVLIIGGGPSGLKVCKSLVEAGVTNVCLLEKKLEVGGRCKTVVEPPDFLRSLPKAHHDSGALRFNDDHKLVKQEVSAYGLEYTPMSATEKFVTCKSSHNVVPLYSDDLPKGLKTDMSSGGDNDLAAFEAWRELGAGGTRHVTDRDGYDTLYDMSLPEWKHDNEKTHSNQYYTLDRGYQELSNRMREDVEAFVKTDKFVVSAEKKLTAWIVTCADDDVFAAKRLVLACPPHSLFRIKGLGEQLHSRVVMHSVTSFPLLRVFARWRRPHGIKGHFFVPGPVRQVQEITDTLALINYCGGQTAQVWNFKQLTDRKQAEEFLMQRINLLLPHVKQPQRIWWHYWHHAIHFWRPGANVDHMSVCLQQPLGPSDATVLMCGEAISRRWHAWVEGALETAVQTTNTITNNGTIPWPLKQMKTIEGTRLILVGGVVIDPRLNDWMKLHPGGRRLLEKYAGKDATPLFLSKSPLHPDYALSMIFRQMVGFIH